MKPLIVEEQLHSDDISNIKFEKNKKKFPPFLNLEFYELWNILIYIMDITLLLYTLWNILECSGTLWNIPVCSETLWSIPEHSGTFQLDYINCLIFPGKSVIHFTSVM